MEQENTSSDKPVENTGAGNKPEAVKESKPDNLNAERLEQENARIEAALAKREELRARELMGGRADAGKPAKTQAEIEKEELAARIKKNLEHAGYR